MHEERSVKAKGLITMPLFFMNRITYANEVQIKTCEPLLTEQQNTDSCAESFLLDSVLTAKNVPAMTKQLVVFLRKNC